MNNSMSKYLAEALGTFMLCFIGAGAIVSDAFGSHIGLAGIAIAHGLALSIGVSATMNVSGGHLNPAVTILMLATKRISPSHAVAYIISQVVGATIAGIAVAIIYQGAPGGEAALKATGLGTPAPGADVSAVMAMICEIFLTFLLVFAIFGTAVDSRAPKIGGFGIGLTIAADIMMGGPISGAAMNPARVLGPAIANTIFGYGYNWANHWAYWVGPVAGALIAGFLYHTMILARTDD